MLLFFAFCMIQIVGCQIRKSFIETGKILYEKEDLVLQKVLDERIRCSDVKFKPRVIPLTPEIELTVPSLPDDFLNESTSPNSSPSIIPENPNSASQFASPDQKRIIPKKNHRRWIFYSTYYFDDDHQFVTDPKLIDMKTMGITLMQQSLYGAQLRMREMTKRFRRFMKDIRFRMAFLFDRLTSLESQLEIILTIMQRKIMTYYRPFIYIRTVEFWFYYAHGLKQFIDLTYVGEFILDLHDAYIEIKGTTSETTQPEEAEAPAPDAGDDKGAGI